MKNRIKLLIALTIFVQSAIAQTAKVEWGPLSKKKEYVSLYGADGSNIYGIDFGLKKTKYAIVKYDEKLIEQTRQLIVIETNRKNRTLERMMNFNDKILVFTSYYDKSTKKNTLFAQFITFDGKFEGEPIIVEETEEVKKRRWSDYGFKRSQDSSTILVYRSEPIDKENRDVKKFSCKLLDKELKTDWQKDFELEYEDPFAIYGYVVDNNGNLYVMIQMAIRREKVIETREDKKERKEKEKKNKEKTQKRKYDSRFIIQTYNPTTDNLSEYELNPDGKLRGKTITDFGLRVMDNQMVISGFYSETGSRINGCFLMKVDGKTEEVKLEKVKEFDKEFFENIATNSDDAEEDEKPKKKKDKEKDEEEYLTNYQVRHLLNNSDGTMYMVAEQYTYYTTTYTTCDSKGNCRTTTVHHYIYGDILTLSFDKDGDIEWTSRIPKYQHTTGSAYYSSFILLNKDDKLLFLYNDHPKNASLKATKLYNLYLGGKIYKNVPVMVTLDNNGKLSKSQIIEKDPLDKKIKSIMVPDIQLYVNDGIIVKRDSGNKYSYGRLKIE
jgi:hypothetical protein